MVDFQMASYIGLRPVIFHFVGLLEILGVVEVESVHLRPSLESDYAGWHFVLQSYAAKDADSFDDFELLWVSFLQEVVI